MIATILYTLLAIFGLSFLIFIHELGHYWMARRVGMKVETFSIGFGHPIATWTRDGVKWQIGWLLFGGYVKIAGMNAESEEEDVYGIADGFFGKKPWDRIKVAVMGPLVNLVFALLVFITLWSMGGREKNFDEFTNVIGWVDPKSELFEQGVRPGDEIISYNGRPFETHMDHLTAPLTSGDEIKLKINKIDYLSGTKQPLELTVKPYVNPNSASKKRELKTSGILESARYLNYNRFSGGRDNPIAQGSPMANSGILYGDRIVWIDGEFIFSRSQLRDVLNDGRVLLTVKSRDKIVQRRVPRVQVQELRPNAEFREEILDWQYEADLSEIKFDNLYVIPYNLTPDCVIEEPLKFIDQESQEEAFPKNPFSERDIPLQKGDRIIAVQGDPVTLSYQIISQIQEKKIHIIVQRDPQTIEILPEDQIADHFAEKINWENLQKIAGSIGTKNQINSINTLYLLNTVVPKKQMDIVANSENQAWITTELHEKRRTLEQIEDAEKRTQELHRFDKSLNELILGIQIQDRRVSYNPNPLTLFADASAQVWRILTSMLNGSLSPKFVSGPVGIIHLVEGTSMVSLKESFYMLGFISLNLGLLNLLPIPILDGGTILLSFIELLTGYRMKPRTLEKIVVVFAVLLVSFFLFVTYHDVINLFGLG